jgi:phage-related protein
LKPIEFAGDSLTRLREFPAAARRIAGYQLDRIQRDLEPDDWKPLKAVGPGVRELRLRDRAGAFRVIYLATLPDRIAVLHAFQKKTQRTAKQDIDCVNCRGIERWHDDGHSRACGMHSKTPQPKRPTCGRVLQS